MIQFARMEGLQEMTEKKPYSKDKQKYNKQYQKEHMKRIPLTVKIEEYEEVRSHAASRGETVNGFIRRSYKEQMKRDLAENSPETAPEQPHNEE